jgi:hypothetical protein
MRSNWYLATRTLGSRSGGSNLLWHDLILSVRFGSHGSGLMDAQGGGTVAGIPFPWRRFAGVGRSRPSGLHFGRGLAREVEHDTAYTSRYLRRPIRVRVGAPHGGGGTGSRQRVELACSEGKGEGKKGTV